MCCYQNRNIKEFYIYNSNNNVINHEDMPKTHSTDAFAGSNYSPYYEDTKIISRWQRRWHEQWPPIVQVFLDNAVMVYAFHAFPNTSDATADGNDTEADGEYDDYNHDDDDTML